MDNAIEVCASLALVRADCYQGVKEIIEQRYTNMQARKVDLAEKADKTLNVIEACPEDGWYIDGLGQDQNDLSAMKGKGKGYGKGKSGGGKGGPVLQLPRMRTHLTRVPDPSGQPSGASLSPMRRQGSFCA